MKKHFIAAIVVLLVLGSTVGAQRLPQLKGDVEHENGEGVGSGKPVYVYFMNPPIKMDEETVYTSATSRYVYPFDPPVYFWKVRCRFFEGGSWYSGETIIMDTLYVDTEIDITVYEEPPP